MTVYGAALLTVKSLPANSPPPPPPPIVPPPPPPATTRYSTVAGAIGVPNCTPPTYKLPAIPVPPVTCNAPVAFVVATVLGVIAKLVPVTIAILALPTALKFILPLADGMLTLLFQLLTLEPAIAIIPVN